MRHPLNNYKETSEYLTPTKNTKQRREMGVGTNVHAGRVKSPGQEASETRGRGLGQVFTPGGSNHQAVRRVGGEARGNETRERGRERMGRLG